MPNSTAVGENSLATDTGRLRESQTRLDLLNGIYNAITNRSDPGTVIADAVRALAKAFCGCQVYYGEVSSTGRFEAIVVSPTGAADFAFDLAGRVETESLIKE